MNSQQLPAGASRRRFVQGSGAAASRLIFGSLRPYQRAWLRPDLVAGARVWAVLVPESFVASMLEELAATLAPRGITLAAAGNIGTVRDVGRAAGRAASAEGALALSPSVDDATAAREHGS